MHTSSIQGVEVPGNGAAPTGRGDGGLAPTPHTATGLGCISFSEPQLPFLLRAYDLAPSPDLSIPSMSRTTHLSCVTPILEFSKDPTCQLPASTRTHDPVCTREQTLTASCKTTPGNVALRAVLGGPATQTGSAREGQA